MPYMTQEERRELFESSTYVEFHVLSSKECDYGLVELEDFCFDLDEALSLVDRRLHKQNFNYAEVFRLQSDGTLKKTIGGFYRSDNNE